MRNICVTHYIKETDKCVRNEELIQNAAGWKKTAQYNSNDRMRNICVTHYIKETHKCVRNEELIQNAAGWDM